MFGSVPEMGRQTGNQERLSHTGERCVVTSGVWVVLKGVIVQIQRGGRLKYWEKTRVSAS